MARIDQRGNAPKNDRHRAAQELYQSHKEDRLDHLDLRQRARAGRTSQQQLDLLDERLGKGVGAAKERARLQKQIEKESGNE